MDATPKKVGCKMKFLLKTKVLIASALVFGGLTFWDLKPQVSPKSSLPVIEALIKDDIQRVALTSMGNTITLEQSDVWTQVAPLNGLADEARINAMILNFRKPIEMDVLVETDPDKGGKSYGLDSSNAIVVEMWGIGDAEPSISFLLGNDTDQGASFIRMSGSKSVYRAHVGGRRRFAHQAGAWLNQRVLQLKMSDISSLTVEGADNPSYTLENGDVWTARGEDIPLDVKRLSQAFQTLLLMRIGEEPISDIGEPWMRLTLTQKDGVQEVLEVADPVDRQTHVQVGDAIYRVPVLPFERFASGIQYFMDKRVFPIRSREELDLIRYKTELTDIVIQQDLADGFWKVLQPSNVDLEMRDVFFMVNTLVSLSSVREVPLVDVPPTPTVTLEMRRLKGDVFRLWIFDYQARDGALGYLCQIEGAESAFLAPKEDIERIINGFGQSNVF